MNLINIKNFFEKLNKFRFSCICGILLLTLIALFSGQNTIPPIDRDEARFAQASRQMIQTNDFVNIKFQDELRAKKPVGIYWIQALSANVFGETKISSFRFPSIIFSLISLIFIGLLTRLIFPFYQSLIVVLFFGSSFVFIGEAHLAKTDATLLALICVQQYYLLKLILKKGSLAQIKFWYPLVIWIAFAFGILVKGPLSIVILSLTTISFCFVKKDFSLLKSLNPLLGIIVSSIIILPWIIAINEATQGLFIEKAFNDDFFSKLKSGQEGHGAWPGMHLIMLSITLWPLAMIIPGSIIFFLNNKSNLVVQFLICWIIPFWFLIEIVPTKLIHYSLPILPAITILSLGSIFHSQSQIQNIKNNIFHKLILTLSIIFGFGGLILGSSILYFSFKFNYNEDSTILIGSILVFIITIIIFSLSLILITQFKKIPTLLKKSVYNIPLLIIAFACMFNIINYQFIFPKLDYLYPSKLIIKKIQTIKPDAVASAGYHEPSLVFLFNGEIMLSSPQEVAIFMAEGNKNIGLVEAQALEEFLDKSKEINLSVKTEDIIKGYNIAKGKHVKIHIFRNQTFDVR